MPAILTFKSPIGNVSPNLDISSRGDCPSDHGGVLVLFKFGPVARDEFKIAGDTKFVRWHAIEHDHIETRAAIVRKDLNRHHVSDAIEPGDLLVVVLRQVTRGGTELIGLKRNERALGLLPSLQFVHALLHGADETKYKQRDRRTAHGQKRPRAMAPKGFENIGGEFEHDGLPCGERREGCCFWNNEQNDGVSNLWRAKSQSRKDAKLANSNILETIFALAKDEIVPGTF